MAIAPDPALTNGTMDATPAPQPTPDTSAPSNDTTQSGLPGVPTSAPAQVTQPQAAALASKATPAPAAPSMDSTISTASTGKGATGILRGILVGALRGASAHLVGKPQATPAPQAQSDPNAQPQPTASARKGGIGQVFKNIANNSPKGQELRKNLDEHTASQLAANNATLLAHHYALENQKDETAISEHAEDRAAKVQADNDAANQASQDFIDMAKREGIEADFSHGPGHDNLGPSHAADAAQGTTVHVQNGETGKDAGVVILPVNQLKATPLSKDFKTPSTFEIDPKTGDVKVTGYATLPSGSTTVWQAHQMYQNFMQQTADAQKQWTDGQKRRLDAANVDAKLAEAGSHKTPEQVAAESGAEVKQKNAEAGKANADAAKAKQETSQSAAVNPPGSAGLTGDAYLATLTPGEADTIKAVAEGRQTLSPRQLLDKNGNATPFAQQLHRAYPDFDDKKALGYGAAVKDFTSGKTSVLLTSGGTALGHLYELQQLNTPASHIPHTPAWTAYQNKAATVATELAKFYGDATIPGIQAIENTLTSTLPGNRDAAITTQAQSMGDKLDSLEQQWRNASPTSMYQPPVPNIDASARAARVKLDPKYAQRVSQSQTQSGTTGGNNAPPTAQTHVFDPQAWAAANPGKDVNAAIQAAKSQGYQVKQ
jgi:hypothetical protein